MDYDRHGSYTGSARFMSSISFRKFCFTCGLLSYFYKEFPYRGEMVFSSQGATTIKALHLVGRDGSQGRRGSY